VLNRLLFNRNNLQVCAISSASFELMMLSDDAVSTLRLPMHLETVLIEGVLRHCNNSSSVSVWHIGLWGSAWCRWHIWNWWLSTRGLKIAHVGVQSCFGSIGQVNRKVSAVHVIILIDNCSLLFIYIKGLRTVCQGLAVLVNCLEHGLIRKHHRISWHDYRWFLIATQRRLLLRLCSI